MKLPLKNNFDRKLQNYVFETVFFTYLCKTNV